VPAVARPWNLGGGLTFAQWTWGPFCFTDKGANYSWNYWPAWVHMAIWAQFGVSYVWGCFNLADIELGRRNPSRTTVRQIAEALDVSMVELGAAVEREG
jgi:hypothetical protein